MTSGYDMGGVPARQGYADPDRPRRTGAFLASTVPARGAGFLDPTREARRRADAAEREQRRLAGAAQRRAELAADREREQARQAQRLQYSRAYNATRRRNGDTAA